MKFDGTMKYELRRAIKVHGVDGEVSELVFREMKPEHEGFYYDLRDYMIEAQTKSIELAQEFSKFQSQDVTKIGEAVSLDVNDDGADDALVELISMALGKSGKTKGLVSAFTELVKLKSDFPICTASGVAVKELAWDSVHPEDKLGAAVKYCVFFEIGLGLLSKDT